MSSFEELEQMIGGRSPLEPLVDEPGVPADLVTACQSLLRGYLGMAPCAIGVTSAARGEGRSTIAATIAWLLRSQLGRPTVLLELDATAQSDSGAATLGDVMAGRTALMDAISWTAQQYGRVSLCADAQRATTEVTKFRTSSVVADLQSAGYSVVGDLPALPPAGLADRVVSIFTSTILVVRAGVTPVSEVRAAVGMLPERPEVVLNAVTSPVPRWLRMGRSG